MSIVHLPLVECKLCLGLRADRGSAYRLYANAEVLLNRIDAYLLRSCNKMYLIWLPRTLMLSSGWADCPFSMSFTFFKCVFMAMSTPAKAR